MGWKNEAPSYNYKCSLTGESFTVTRKISQSDELISIKAWYQLNPERDDRPEAVKKEHEQEEQSNVPS